MPSVRPRSVAAFLLALLTSPILGEKRLAYISLISSEKWVLPARVLGRSMISSGCNISKVLMVTYAIAPRDEALLAGDGWELLRMDRVPSPFNDASEKQRNVFSKVLAFNLTQFDKVMLVDTDFLVLESLDDLFDCGDYCVVHTRRETQGRLNSGLQVISPNSTFFAEMMDGAKTGRYKSYNGGDQGFLNEVMPLWCTHGQKDMWKDAHKDGQGFRKCMSLPERYNRIGVDFDRLTKHLLPTRWSREDFFEDAAALHYNHPSYWAVKPWVFWWYPLLPSNWLWWQRRRQLAGEGFRAFLLLCRYAALPIAAAIALAWHGPPPDFTEKRLALPLQAAPRWFAVRNAMATVVGSLLAFVLIPLNSDALAGWTCYFALKFAVLATVPIASLAGRGQDPRHLRLRSARRALACEVLEVATIWLPQQAGLEWTSNKVLTPICFHTRDIWLYSHLGCNGALWLVAAVVGVVGIALQVLLLQPLWTGSDFRRVPQEGDDLAAVVGRLDDLELAVRHRKR